MPGMRDRELRLHEVVERLRTAGLLVCAPEQDPQLGGLSADDRTVGPGDLFCAWSGTATDSHDFVGSAASKGAVAALVERVVDGVSIPQVVTSDGRRAAALAAALIHGDPADELVLVGVTGTNGKSTTVWLLSHLLGARYSTASLGTLGMVRPGEGWRPGGEGLTTPGPIEVAGSLRTLADEGVEAVALEVSSHALEQGRVAGIRFDAAIFTNLTRDHLDYHGTVERYRAAKRSLVTLIREGGIAVLNGADPAWSGLGESAPRTIEFGVESPIGVWARGVEYGSFGARFELVTAEGAAPVELPLLGNFNLQNALGAAAAALGLGIPLQVVAERLSTTPQVPGRLEKLVDSPCPVLRDYAHTPDALERVLGALRPLVEGRLIVVFGAGGDRDPGKRPLMGEVAERLADLAIVTSDNPRREDPVSIIDEIVAGMSRSNHRVVVDRRDAIELALGEAGPADLVLLAGKGHETYQILGVERHHFDELEVVHELLQGGASSEVRR